MSRRKPSLADLVTKDFWSSYDHLESEIDLAESFLAEGGNLLMLLERYEELTSANSWFDSMAILDRAEELPSFGTDQVEDISHRSNLLLFRLQKILQAWLKAAVAVLPAPLLDVEQEAEGRGEGDEARRFGLYQFGPDGLL